MKKIISLLLCAAMVLSVVGTVAVSPENTVSLIFDSADAASQILLGNGTVSTVPGDCNGDGKVTSKDSIQIKKYLVGLSNNIDLVGADANCDGKVNAKDSLKIKSIIKGLVSPQTAQSASVISANSETALYDETENAAYIIASGTKASARIIPESLKNGFDASEFRYAGILYKAETEGTKGAVYSASETPIKTEYTLYGDGEYHLKLFDLLENEGWNGAVEAIAFDLMEGCKEGDTIYIDSFILTSSLDNLEAAASERVQIRCAPELEVASSGTESSDDTYSIVFNNEESFELLCNPYHAEYKLNKYANCLEFTVGEGKTDPQVFLDLSSLGLSADEYKYVVYTYKLRSGTELERKGEIFFCAGNVAVPTGGCSYGFKMTTDGNLHTVTIDASNLKNSANQKYWNGTIHGMRLDFFQDAAVGEAVFVKSVVLCKTPAAAQNAAAMMTGASPTGAADAKSIIDCFIETCPVDTSGTLFMNTEENKDKLLCLTGGTKDKFTKELYETRIANEILKTTGMVTEIEILDGFDEMKASYDATEKASGYMTYMVKTSADFYVKFLKTQYNMKKVIFDHDLGPDCDDAGAVSIVAKAHRAGEINCLAITTCINNEYSAYAAAAVTDYLGCNDIPHGWNNERNATGMNVRCCKTPATNYWNTHGPWPVLHHNTALLRQIFAENGNKKDITFITTGPITTLYCLFVSGADSISDMTGRELFVNNVSWYMCGGGNFVNTGETEHNFAEDIEATLYVINNLTEVPMTFAGSNVAGHIYTGSVLASCPDAWVVKGCYYHQNYQTGNYARNSWDLATVYFGVYGGAGMWQEKSGYNISVYTNGATIISAGGDRGYIEAIASDDVVRGAFHRGMVPN